MQKIKVRYIHRLLARRMIRRASQEENSQCMAHKVGRIEFWNQWQGVVRSEDDVARYLAKHNYNPWPSGYRGKQ